MTSLSKVNLCVYNDVILIIDNMKGIQFGSMCNHLSLIDCEWLIDLINEWMSL